jgi:glycosyltransferase involved in cell wall biosynthesis
LWRWLIQHRGEFDLIHACDFDTILPALWLKMFHGKCVVYDIFDFYADHLRATPAAFKHIIRKVDLWAIGRVDALILVDEARIPQVTGSRPRSITIIYNSPEDVSRNLPAPEKSVEGGFHLAYIGLLQVERGLLEMLTVLRSHPGWGLDLAGFGGDEAAILSAADGMHNVRWHGRVSYERAVQLSADADVLFATYDPSIPNHRYSSPNKVFEAMMLGKPVIVAAGTNMDRIIAEADCGCIVPYGDVPSLESTLVILASDPELVRKLGHNARQAYETRYAWFIMSQRLASLYEKVLQQ